MAPNKVARTQMIALGVLALMLGMTLAACTNNKSTPDTSVFSVGSAPAAGVVDECASATVSQEEVTGCLFVSDTGASILSPGPSTLDVTPRGTVSFGMNGFGPATVVKVMLDSKPVTPITVTVDENGFISGDVVLPALSLGSHIVDMVGTTADGKRLVRSGKLNVTGKDKPVLNT